jgi:hypothetical protein
VAARLPSLGPRAGPRPLEEQLAEAIEAKKQRDPKGSAQEPRDTASAPDPVPDHDTRHREGVEHEDESHLSVDHETPAPKPKAPRRAPAKPKAA